MESAKYTTGSNTLIYACSGAADVGQLADLTARRMTTDGLARMSCLAGLGGRVQSITQQAAAAKTIVAIDGCGQLCCANCLDLAGFDDYIHVNLPALGLEKGNTPPTEENIDKCVKFCIDTINAS